MAFTPKNRREQWMKGLIDRHTDLTPRNKKEEFLKEFIQALADIEAAAASGSQDDGGYIG